MPPKVKITKEEIVDAAVELGAVSSALLPPQAVKRPAPRIMHNAKIAIFFI